MSKSLLICFLKHYRPKLITLSEILKASYNSEYIQHYNIKSNSLFLVLSYSIVHCFQYLQSKKNFQKKKH